VRIISRKAIREFVDMYPQADSSLNAWFRIAKSAAWGESRRSPGGLSARRFIRQVHRFQRPWPEVSVDICDTFQSPDPLYSSSFNPPRLRSREMERWLLLGRSTCLDIKS
jgi:hypothetical protein